VCESWLYEAVCRQKHEMSVRVGYLKLCVDRELNCGWDLVIWSCV